MSDHTRKLHFWSTVLNQFWIQLLPFARFVSKWELWGFFLLPIWFLAGNIIVFFVSYHYAYQKTSPGHSLFFWFVEPFICFWSFCFMFFIYFSCFVIDFCAVLCYSVQLDMPSCFHNGRHLWGFFFPRLEKTRSWPVIGFPAHVKYYKKKERRVWESFVILMISSCSRLNNFIKFSLSSARTFGLFQLLMSIKAGTLHYMLHGVFVIWSIFSFISPVVFNLIKEWFFFSHMVMFRFWWLKSNPFMSSIFEWFVVPFSIAGFLLARENIKFLNIRNCR